MTAQEQRQFDIYRDRARELASDAVFALNGPPTPADVAAIGQRLALAMTLGRYTVRKGAVYVMAPRWLWAIIYTAASNHGFDLRGDEHLARRQG